jgi:hypothetical protein
MAWATVATDLHQLGTVLSADLIGWGAAVIGVALLAMSVWALRGFGKQGVVATDFWGASSSSAEDQRLI